MYKNWKIGEFVKICTKVEDFCSPQSNYLYLYSLDIERSDTPCNISCIMPDCSYRCLSTVGKSLTAYSCMGFHPSQADVNCSITSGRAEKIYRKLGDTYTDSSGIAYILFQVTDQDMADYQDALSNGNTYDIFVCTNDSGFLQHSYGVQNITVSLDVCAGVVCGDICIGNNLYWGICDPNNIDPNTGKGTCVADTSRQPKETSSIKCLPATHTIDFQVDLVPAELIQYFQQYIVYISDNLMSWMISLGATSLPTNWVYKSTIYDVTSNTFKILLIYTGTLSGLNINALGIIEDMANLWTWATTHKLTILSAILAAIAAILIISGFPFIALFLLLGSIVFLTIGINTIQGEVVMAKIRAKNSDTLAGQQNKENSGIVNINNTWESSSKGKPDCTTRLTAVRDLHISIIDGYKEQFNQYPNIVNSLDTERSSYQANAKAVIDAFDAETSYDSSICDTYYSRLRDKGDLSNTNIYKIISNNVPTGNEYNPPVLCADHKTKEECEAAGCTWDSNTGVCKTKDCAIPSPLGGCLLYKSTAESILIFGAALVFGVIALGIVMPARKK